MTTFALPASAVEAKAPDPTKHVNYTLGMVLGVDDFNQEFAWLSGRGRWLARDAVGYGTLSGLAVSSDTAAKGPRLVVSSGNALTPRGQLVCVKPAQCAYLNDWLAANKAGIPALVGSPMAATITLYLTLCYRDCPTDPMPIPGEPCRSEDELLQPSRLVDSFSLELRTTPPRQEEEDAVVELVRWLRAAQIGGPGPYTTVEQFVLALRGAVQKVSSPPSSPLSSPPGAALGVHFNFGSPLLSLRLDPARAGEYWRAAFRVWIEEIRPLVHALCAGGCACCGDPGGATAATAANSAPDECLLLARVDVPVVNLGAGEWRVDDLRSISIDESRRPLLLHLRLLEEWVAAGGQAAAPGPPPKVSTAAAGVVGDGFAQPPLAGNLAATFDSPGRLKLTFAGYGPPDATSQYVVKAMALNASGIGVGNPTIVSDGFDGSGLFLKVTNGAAAITDDKLKKMQFMVEVTRVQ
jgi:hypothetical protein